MTTLNSPVIRKTRGFYCVLYQKPRPIVVKLDHDAIEFREYKRRRAWTLPIDTAFRYAVRLAVFQAAAEKRRNTPELFYQEAGK